MENVYTCLCDLRHDLPEHPARSCGNILRHLLRISCVGEIDNEHLVRLSREPGGIFHAHFTVPEVPHIRLFDRSPRFLAPCIQDRRDRTVGNKIIADARHARRDIQLGDAACSAKRRLSDRRNAVRHDGVMSATDERIRSPFNEMSVFCTERGISVCHRN